MKIIGYFILIQFFSGFLFGSDMNTEYKEIPCEIEQSTNIEMCQQPADSLETIQVVSGSDEPVPGNMMTLIFIRTLDEILPEPLFIFVLNLLFEYSDTCLINIPAMNTIN